MDHEKAILDGSEGVSQNDSASQTRVVFIGVGGATCSGKTTLAKHLRACIPDSVIVHQDDFAPPEDLIPLHPVHQVPDWDSPSGAIDWPRLRSFLRSVKSTGHIPPEHRSHDHLNEQKDVGVQADVRQAWVDRIEEALRKKAEHGQSVVCVILDGFLLYWDQEVVDMIDIRIFLRVPESMLRKRRKERQGYYTAEGGFWVDPPRYFDDIVYPAYLEAHSHMFTNGDVESGSLKEEAKGVILIDANHDSNGNDEKAIMTRVLSETCKELVKYLENN